MDQKGVVLAVLAVCVLGGCTASAPADVVEWRVDVTERINDAERRLEVLENADEDATETVAIDDPCER